MTATPTLTVTFSSRLRLDRPQAEPDAGAHRRRWPPRPRRCAGGRRGTTPPKRPSASASRTRSRMRSATSRSDRVAAGGAVEPGSRRRSRRGRAGRSPRMAVAPGLGHLDPQPLEDRGPAGDTGQRIDRRGSLELPRCRSIVRRARSSSSIVLRSSRPSRSASGVGRGPGRPRDPRTGSPQADAQPADGAARDGVLAAAGSRQGDAEEVVEPRAGRPGVEPERVGRLAFQSRSRRWPSNRRLHRRGCAASSGRRRRGLLWFRLRPPPHRDDSKRHQGREADHRLRRCRRDGRMPIAPVACGAGSPIAPLDCDCATAAGSGHVPEHRIGAIGVSRSPRPGWRSAARPLRRSDEAVGRPDRPGRAGGDPPRSERSVPPPSRMAAPTTAIQRRRGRRASRVLRRRGRRRRRPPGAPTRVRHGALRQPGQRGDRRRDQQRDGQGGRHPAHAPRRRSAGAARGRPPARPAGGRHQQPERASTAPTAAMRSMGRVWSSLAPRQWYERSPLYSGSVYERPPAVMSRSAFLEATDELIATGEGLVVSPDWDRSEVAAGVRPAPRAGLGPDGPLSPGVAERGPRQRAARVLAGRSRHATIHCGGRERQAGRPAYDETAVERQGWTLLSDDEPKRRPDELPIAPGGLAAVLAHPDDESFGCAGALALAHEAGKTTRLLVATRGEAGTADGNPDASFGDTREAELICAAHGRSGSTRCRSSTAMRTAGIADEPFDRLVDEIAAWLADRRPRR